MSAARARGVGALASTCSVLLAAACTALPDLPVGTMMPASSMPVAAATPAPVAASAAAVPMAAAGAGMGGGTLGGSGAMEPDTGSRSAGAPGGAGRSESVAGASAMVPSGAAGMKASAGTAAAGASGQAGNAGMLAAGRGGGMPLPAAPGPALPAIRGACPEFRDGTTIMVAGHGGILIAAGAPGMGGPLLFYWHADSLGPSEVMSIPAAVRSEMLSSGGIIAAFDGSKSSGSGPDCTFAKTHNEADFNAADQIAACAVENHGIDSRRIYTTGCNSGALQSGCMALMRSSYLAAAATNSGGLVPPSVAVIEWQDKHAPAIFAMHGGDSDVILVNFVQTSAALAMNAKNHGSFVVDCDHGGGTCQASAELRLAAWQFMKDHRWGFEKSPWASALPAGVPPYCKIY